ncbi:hypothetical protein NC651_004559 [Populus alba x Populus x berolinensis]|nr:hypothetical protein NC651_004559 [Populus alba x Populus x berolinensis]
MSSLCTGACLTHSTRKICASIEMVSQLGAAAQKYQAATQTASSNLSVPELQNNCTM